ncbi:major facilitator superfamily transporter [Rhodococcus opacus PD630]|uniref:MFS transporter n=1 Tax=Rhodococcus opacus TaxID=37919 RepID=UPI00029CD13C|nr:MFS transporter [Rhodococcus opacus]AHK31841.1 Cephamycin export protein CmcT [Rhodococcus opacus PD630]EHI45144.1 major facilitator superfamily transporter [Rhodococcus opacus PD630]UDG94333.1 MFS transporter [Rhodococcus opacus PD630]
MTTAVSGRTAATPAAILGIILASYFMVLLDNSVIFTGLPSIRSGLELSPAALSWVQDAYTLVFGGLLLMAARAGDIVGRRRLFRIGLAIFGTASLLIGLAPAGWWMIAARAVQGIGAAIVAPTSLALITTYFDGEARNKAVAWYAATAGIGASLGLLVGGALTEWISWRAAFLVNVPIAVALIVWSSTVLTETPRRTGRFDVIGALGATLGMGAVIFGIIESAEAGWGSARVQIALALGAVLLIGLVVHEGRVQQPILPLRLFRSRERSGAYTARLLYLGAMIGFFYFTTQLLQDGLGFSPLQAGLGFLPMTLVNFVVALMVPRLSARLSNGTLLATGTALTLAGMAWLSRIDPLDTYLVDVALPMILVGAGQGLAFGPLTNAGIAGVDSADAGAASGLVNTAHQLGMALGLGVLVALSANTGSNLDGPAAVTDHVGTALTGGTVLLVVALVVVLTVIVPAARHRSSGSAPLRPAP